MKCAGHITHRGGKKYRGVDKSLARPGRKQARKHVRDARDFNNIETRAAIKYFFLYAYRAVVEQRDQNASIRRRKPTWQDDIKTDQTNSVGMVRSGLVRLLIGRGGKLL